MNEKKFGRNYPWGSGVYRLRVMRIILFVMIALAWLGNWKASPGVAAPTAETAYAKAEYLTIYNAPPVEPDQPYKTNSMAAEEKPKLLLPDLRTIPPYDLEIATLEDGSRELRLSNTIWNSGSGPLELEGETNPTTQQTRVVQHIYTQSGELIDHLVGEFIWHPKHDHWHFEEFSIYELWTLTPAGGLDRIISSSDKISYCVIDTDVIDREKEGFPPNKHYRGCGRTLQGLSVGWGDTYKSFLDGQSIQLAGVKDGFFALKSTANPDAIMVEANHHNNVALIYLEIRGEHIELIEPAEHIERHCGEGIQRAVQDIFCRN